MKMKRIVMIVAALAVLATGCSKGQKFTLKGDLASAGFSARTDSLILQSDAFPQLVTIPVQDGTFSYSGQVDAPVAASLKAVGGEMATQMVVLEKGVITFQDGAPAGTALNDASSELLRSLKAIVKENSGNRSKIQEEAGEEIREYLSDHGKDASAVLAILLGRRLVEPAVLSELIASTAPAVQNDSHVHRISKQLKSMRKE